MITTWAVSSTNTLARKQVRFTGPFGQIHRIIDLCASHELASAIVRVETSHTGRPMGCSYRQRDAAGTRRRDACATLVV